MKKSSSILLELFSIKSLALLLLLVCGGFTSVLLITYSYLDNGSLNNNDDDEATPFFLKRRRKQDEPLDSEKEFYAKLEQERKNDKHNYIKQNRKGKRIKEEYETRYPPNNMDRIKSYVNDELRRKDEYQTQLDVPYHIYNCPPTPPINYPYAWNAMDLIRNWNPGNTTEPERLHQSLCVFDYDTSLDSALTYRNLEVPFLLRNTPEILRTSERWNRDPDNQYLSKLLEGKNRIERVEHSHNPHFMYFRIEHQVPEGWTPPMEESQMTFDEWYDRAKHLSTDQYLQERYYFQLNSIANGVGQREFLYNELPIFGVTDPTFFMVESDQARGINCRFGMKGIIAETHYDSSRNFIVLMGGKRRYVLAHPKECPNLGLYPMHHPSGRHSAVDWIQPDLQQFPQFATAQLNEVVLQAGDALYLPTSWFHFIVSLNTNYQCNARSGTTYENEHHLAQCGFAIPPQ